MKTRLRILNLLLIVACGFAVWQMRANHVEAKDRMDRMFSTPKADAKTTEVAIEPLPEAPKAAEYREVAMRMVFSQDRNPNVVVEEKAPEPEKKMPPLPVLHGVMDLGDGPEAMLSVDAGGKQDAYKAGDTIGDFKVVSVSKEKIVFEWEGKEVVKKASELRSSEPVRSKKTTADNVAKPAPVVKNEPPPPPAKPGAGKDLGGRERACQPGEKSPDGTVVDGWVKRTSYSPMGAVCYWEPVNK